MLTLHEYIWAGQGPGLLQNRTAIGFEVVGLPPSQQAWIATDNHDWQVLRATDGGMANGPVSSTVPKTR